MLIEYLLIICLTRIKIIKILNSYSSIIILNLSLNQFDVELKFFLFRFYVTMYTFHIYIYFPETDLLTDP